MFTGIITEVGRLRAKTPQGEALRLHFSGPATADGLRPGDSVACNGVCLTAETVDKEGFTATAVPETLSRTTLGDLAEGDAVNLEPALKAGTPLGGHFVQGHVDGVAEAVEMRVLPGGGGSELLIHVPGDLARYCVEKGSFALQGVSLTIASAEGTLLRFALVPHTLAHTNLGSVKPTHRLNVEVDMLGKYVEKLLAAAAAKPRSRLDEATLEKWGYGV